MSYISLDEIKQVECARIAEHNSQKSFDIKVITKKEEFQFNGIDRDDYEPIIKYFSNKKVKMVNSEQGGDIDVSMTVIVDINIRIQAIIEDKGSQQRKRWHYLQVNNNSKINR